MCNWALIDEAIYEYLDIIFIGHSETILPDDLQQIPIHTAHECIQVHKKTVLQSQRINCQICKNKSCGKLLLLHSVMIT